MLKSLKAIVQVSRCECAPSIYLIFWPSSLQNINDRVAAIHHPSLLWANRLVIQEIEEGADGAQLVQTHRDRHRL